jgi:hypothetical protein
VVILLELQSDDAPAAQIVGAGRPPQAWHAVDARRHGMACSAVALRTMLWWCAPPGGASRQLWFALRIGLLEPDLGHHVYCACPS